jgi:hypothetical protein
MALPDKATPRQYADQIVIDQVASTWRYIKHYGSFEDANLSPKEQDAVLNRLAKIHNQLLADSGLDGIELEVTA